ncbi:MAG: SIMPL domain-containing protein [Ferruginibacter sp.]|nr:SIMPL domain-containing protein [Cytophagales bacterium]
MPSSTTWFRFFWSTGSLLLVSALAVAQSSTPDKPPVRKIEVTGSAEQEITPDEIYFSISLREYLRDKSNKVALETLEKQLQSAVGGAGIPKDNFRVENVYGNRWHWQKKKPEEFLASKRYVLKLSDLNKVDGILEKVDAKGIESANVSSYTHSKMEQYRREIKTAALKSAKEKARYLLEGIGEKVGQALEVQEVSGDYSPQPMYDQRARMSNLASSEAASDLADGGSDIEFRKIKIRYEMRAVFAIQ